MATLKFERFERDTPYNKERRATGDLRSIIYDFRVLIGGDYRAELHRESFGKGYRLYDAGGRPIPDPSINWQKHLGWHVDKQSDFEDFIHNAEAAGRIPSMIGLLELRCADATLAIQIDCAAFDEIKQNRIRAHASDLHAALLKLAGDANKLLNSRPDDEPSKINLRGALMQAAPLLMAIEAPATDEMMEGARWNIRRNLPVAVS